MPALNAARSNQTKIHEVNSECHVIIDDFSCPHNKMHQPQAPNPHNSESMLKLIVMDKLYWMWLYPYTRGSLNVTHIQNAGLTKCMLSTATTMMAFLLLQYWGKYPRYSKPLFSVEMTYFSNIMSAWM